MPREKDFDQNEVVRKCTLLFSKNGYSATGIQEIVDATKINRSSLYATFKGKDELFLSCLDKAAKDEIALLTGLQKKSEGLKFLDGYLLAVTKDPSFLHLFKFATAEFKLLNRKTQNYINKHYQWKYQFLLKMIQGAQKSGKISGKTNAKDIVALMEMIIMGIQNLSPTADGTRLYKKSALQFSSLIKKKK
jgi:TetR/AcrR family transcriptional regulator, transcriptional repressor for nem operon